MKRRIAIAGAVGFASLGALCCPAAAQDIKPGPPAFIDMLWGPQGPVVPSPDPTGTSPELARLNQQILAAPTNTELNLHYARLAEKLGFRRKALTAYERILVYDPTNVEAQAGIDAIRRQLRPNQTQWTLETGIAYESNPNYSPTIHNHDGQFLAALSMKDERNLGDMRWRTLGTGILQAHDKTETSGLDYGYLGIATGPVWDIWPGLTVNPALGGATSWFDQRFFYNEAAASATFETYPDGAYRAVRVRAAYRDYGETVASDNGWYADIVGRFSFPRVLGEDTVLVFAPWARWSDFKLNSNVSTLLTDIQPGAYTEVGGKVELYYNVYDWLTVGGTFSAAERFYRTDLATSGTGHREDTILSPGAMAVFPNLLFYQSDLRVEYRYISGHSNDTAASFVDHLVSMTVVTRF